MNKVEIPTNLTPEQIEQVESLIESFKPKKWEPKPIEGRQYYVAYTGKVACALCNYLNPEFGNAFPTEKHAKQAAKEIRAYLRLSAYVREFDLNHSPDWDSHKRNYSVLYSNYSNKWVTVVNQYESSPTVVYMSEKCAKDLVDKLNSGEVVL